MAELRTAADRKASIINDTNDTFYFEHQSIDEVRDFDDGIFENTILFIPSQFNSVGRNAVIQNQAAIENAASEFSINADIVKAVIYAENSRGWYDGFNPLGSSSVLPGNVRAEWEVLIPGSDVNDVNDNIRLTAKLLSEIASRLTNPYVEDVYALYNSMSHDRTYENAETKSTPFFVQQVFLAQAWNEDEWYLPNRPDILPSGADECFLASTLITLCDGSRKLIAEIAPGDQVLSYDAEGCLVPSRVVRTFQNHVKHILDVHGLMVTPGHVTLCGDGKFDGQHVPMIDILRTDGALVRQDGSKFRAATNCDLGSPEDHLIWAITGETAPDGSVTITSKGQIRLGTRYISADGRDISVAELVSAAGGTITGDGMILLNGIEIPFHWTFGDKLPAPEDYILQRSRLDLHEIYQVAEWEAMRPNIPAPLYGEAGPTITDRSEIRDGLPPNIPINMSPPDAPTMNRQQRRAHEARIRKQSSSAALH